MTLSRHASSSHSNFGAAGQRGRFIIVELDQQPACLGPAAPAQPRPGSEADAVSPSGPATAIPESRLTCLTFPSGLSQR